MRLTDKFRITFHPDLLEPILKPMTTPSNPPPSDPQNPPRQPSALDVVFSVLASFFGVQSARNQERDFRHGRAAHFISVAIGLTLLLIFGIWLAVKLALRAAGA